MTGDLGSGKTIDLFFRERGGSYASGSRLYMLEDRSVEQKRKIVAGITQAMVEGAGTEAKEVHAGW